MSENSLKILLAASECVPFVKTGGLADVAYALPRALLKAGNDVRVVLPLYSQIREKYANALEHLCDFYMRLGWRNQYVGVEKLVYNDITFYFIDNEFYFKRGYVYGGFSSDEAERYGYFSKAILEMLTHIDFMPDVLHLNDWQTAMCAPLLKTQYAHIEKYVKIRTVLTIHNLRFQGVFDRGFVDELLTLGAPCFDTNGLEFNGCVNYLKGGLVYSDALTTVSPTYASEIQYPYYGEMLDGVLRLRSGVLHGILNGIDYEEYDPAKDKLIAANYSSSELDGKRECKRALCRECGFDESSDAPIIAIVSRLTSQKGLDLIERMISEILEQDIRLVVLGAGEQKYENMFAWAMWRYEKRVFSHIGYDAELAHRIYAGADIFLMPSQFEPCGLSQLIAMRYGTIPIVRETGGLRDTVESYNKYTDEGTGFSFLNYNAHELYYTIKDAAEHYQERVLWDKLMRRAMSTDFSWKNSAQKYTELYYSLVPNGEITVK